MKTLATFGLVIALLAPSVRAETDAAKAEAYYKQGRAAELAGDPDKASSSYRAALKLNPNHVDARYRLGEVKVNAESIKLSAVKAKIEEVNIPTYQIEEATIHEALALLAVAMEKHSEGKVTPNFVVDDPNKKLENVKLTLNLKNIPAKAILTYMTTQTNTKIRYDEYAVVIQSR